MRGNPDDIANQIISKIKDWLKHEVESQQDVADAKDNKEDWVTSDGTDDIIYGRHECAEGLLKQIDKWEKEYDL